MINHIWDHRSYPWYEVWMTVLCLCIFTLLPSAAVDVGSRTTSNKIIVFPQLYTALLTFESMLNEAGAGWGWPGLVAEHSTAVSVACSVLRAPCPAPLFTCKFNVWWAGEASKPGKPITAQPGTGGGPQHYQQYSYPGANNSHRLLIVNNFSCSTRKLPLIYT